MNTSKWVDEISHIQTASLNGIQTHNLCNTGAAVLYRPSFEANLGLVYLGVCNKPVDDDYGR